MAASSGLLIPVSKRLFRAARNSARSEARPKGSSDASSDIVPAVSVPVLSLHRMSMLPRFWIAERCFTITFSRAIWIAPCASVTVVIIGRNSGVRPTASATEKSSDSSGLRPKPRFTTRMNSTRKTTVCRISIPKRRVPRSNSVSSGRAARRSTMSPNAVSRPDAKTTAVAVPLTIEVPRKTRPGESGPLDESASFAASFSAGSDSPVRAPCWTCRSTASIRRASAGTRSPAASRTTSPTTSCAPGQLAPCAVAPHRGRRRDLLLEPLHRPVGAEGLPEVDPGAQRRRSRR